MKQHVLDISAAIAAAKREVAVLDDAGWHRSKDLKVPKTGTHPASASQFFTLPGRADVQLHQVELNFQSHVRHRRRRLPTHRRWKGPVQEPRRTRPPPWNSRAGGDRMIGFAQIKNGPNRPKFGRIGIATFSNRLASFGLVFNVALATRACPGMRSAANRQSEG